MKILALDIGTKMGWAHSCGVSGVWDLSVRRDESGGMKLIRLRSKLNEIYNSEGIELVVFEAVRHAAPGMQGALVVGAELQGVLKVWCEVDGIEYRGYSPSEIKKHATGKGNTNKQMMLDLAREKWGHIEDDNEADAKWLLDLAQLQIEIIKE